MTLLEQVLGRLNVPGTLPEVVTRVAITVQYSPAAAARDLPTDRFEIWHAMADEVADGLNKGFLTRPFAKDASAAGVVTMDGPDRMVIEVTTPGAHVNLVHVMVRLVVASHHTPADAYPRLLDALDGDEEAANEAFNGMIFDRDIGALTVQVAGPEGLEPMPVDIRQALWHNVHVPASGPIGDALLVEADEIAFTNLQADALDEDLEDAFLSLAGMNAFIPIGHDAAHEPGEEELFFTGPGTLLAHTVSMEQIFLFELVATLNGGDLSRAQAEVTQE
ncbi:hypothetical protein [Tateyamaria sp. SN6-1]|uniref:hypothetical protein n=1 Tax=Tateyamaria sp. SN6-1 TaxID=3092148 RepID=UPI0039F53E19